MVEKAALAGGGAPEAEGLAGGVCADEGGFVAGRTAVVPSVERKHIIGGYVQWAQISRWLVIF
jgi:hypothetical protein